MNLGLGMGLSRRSAASGSAPAFTPASVFTAGVDGVWSSPISVNDLWQDVARTTPVTATGQAVASWQVNTSSGVTYMEQATAGSRPTYEIDGNGAPYLEFSGTDQMQSVGTFSTPLGNEESTLLVAVDFDGTYADNSGFLTYYPALVTGGFHRTIAMNGSGAIKVDTAFPGNSVLGGTIPTTFAVLEGRFATQISAAIDGGSFTTITPSSATNTPANQRLAVGRGISTGFAAGKYYGILHVVKPLTTQERTDLVAWMAALANP
jgi:hypothetical protein